MGSRGYVFAGGARQSAANVGTLTMFRHAGLTAASARKPRSRPSYLPDNLSCSIA